LGGDLIRGFTHPPTQTMFHFAKLHSYTD